MNWRREVGAVGGQPPSDLALEMLFVKKMVSFGYNINPIASFVFDKYKNSYVTWQYEIFSIFCGTLGICK